MYNLEITATALSRAEFIGQLKKIIRNLKGGQDAAEHSSSFGSYSFAVSTETPSEEVDDTTTEEELATHFIKKSIDRFFGWKEKLEENKRRGEEIEYMLYYDTHKELVEKYAELICSNILEKVKQEYRDTLIAFLELNPQRIVLRKTYVDHIERLELLIEELEEDVK